MRTKWPHSVRFTADVTPTELTAEALIQSFAAIAATSHAQRLADILCTDRPVHAYEFLDAIARSRSDCIPEEMRGQGWVQFEWNCRMEEEPVSVAWSMTDGLCAEVELSLCPDGQWSLDIVAVRDAVPAIIRRIDRRIALWTAKFKALNWTTTIGPGPMERLIREVPMLSLPA